MLEPGEELRATENWLYARHLPAVYPVPMRPGGEAALQLMGWHLMRERGKPQLALRSLIPSSSHLVLQGGTEHNWWEEAERPQPP